MKDCCPKNCQAQLQNWSSALPWQGRIPKKVNDAAHARLFKPLLRCTFLGRRRMVLGSPTHFIVGSHTCTHLTCHSLPQLTLLLPLEDGQLWFCEAPSSRHHPGIEAHGPVSHQSEHWIPTWAGWRDTRAQSHGAERQINPGWQNTVEGFCLWVFFPHYVQLLLFFGGCFFSFLSVSGGSLSGFWFFLEIAVAQASRQTAKKNNAFFGSKTNSKGYTCTNNKGCNSNQTKTPWSNRHTHTEGATPKRHTNIQVIFNYPKIYDIQKLITNKYKHKHIYIYIRIHIADIKTAHAWNWNTNQHHWICHMFFSWTGHVLLTWNIKAVSHVLYRQHSLALICHKGTYLSTNTVDKGGLTGSM